MEKIQDTVYAFIDSQNLIRGLGNDIVDDDVTIYSGWKLDTRKFYRYLTDKFHVSKAFYFVGHVPQYEFLYSKLRSDGYQVVYKPTVKDGNGKPKGNVDAELVLHASAIEYNNYDKAVFVAGDGDYYCLYKYLNERGKLFKIVIPNRKSESSLLKEFQSYKVFLEFERSKLEYIKGK